MNYSRRNLLASIKEIVDDLEESKSQYSYDFDFDQRCHKLDYLSTNLIYQPNIYVNDVQIEEVNLLNIKHRVDHISKYHDPFILTLYSFDPREALKNAKAKGQAETLVSYEEVDELSKYAVELHL